jgi:hypothetical protein
MTLQDQIDALKAQVQGLEERQRRCVHEWGDVQYAPRSEGGYNAPVRVGCRDTGNTFWVSKQEIPRWRRACRTCGLVQHTERTKEVSRRGQVPGTTATEKVPTFPN